MRSPLGSVLSKIRPEPEEARAERRFAASLRKRIAKHAPPGCRAVITGSMAKGTFLKDKKDIDIFVLFPPSEPRDGLEMRIRSIMENAFPGLGYQVSYAEHPYVRFHIEGRKVDLVPAYRISHHSERISAVDRSVLHTRFIKSHLRPSGVDHVLLLKALLKANHLYGAEIRIQGFSGYLCELLIVRFKTITALAKAASGWVPPVVIDIAGHHEGRKARQALSSRFRSQLTVIDPVDPGRNVAAAVSPGSLKRFIRLCRALDEEPKASMFLKRPESFERRLSRMRRGKAAYLLTMPRPEVVDDVLWGQLNRMIGQMEKRLEPFGPRIIADDSGGRIRIASILERELLPPTELIAGPPLQMERNVRDFKAGHEGASFIRKDGRIFARQKRESRRFREHLLLFLSSYARQATHLSYPQEEMRIERL